MKNFLLALLVSFVCFSESFAQMEDDPKDLVQLEFGRKSKGCAEFGICVFRVHINKDTVGQIITIAALLRQGRVEIQFGKDFYTLNKRYFLNNQLRIDEDYKLDLAASRSLGAPDGYTIKKGVYQVKFNALTNTYNCTF